MQQQTLALIGLVYVWFVNCQSVFNAGLEQQEIKFGQKVDEEILKVQRAEAINTTMKRSFLYSSADKKQMAVYDRLFKRSIILALRSYLTSLGQDSWLFNNYDPDHLNSQRATDNVPWVNYRDPMEFNRMLVSKTLVKAITDLTGKKEEWFPYKVTGKVIRRGDHTRVVADSNETEEFSVLFYLNSKWRKNYYGELYFFDDEKEIMHGVTPRPGRVVIWDSSILRLTRPPSVSFKHGQVLLHVQFTKSKQKMVNEHNKWLSFWNDRLEAKKTWYLPNYKESTEKPLVPNVADHVVANFSTLKGEKLFVFDGLFPVDLLDHMRAHVLKYGTYFYDDSIDDVSDNVQWIAGLDMPMYLKSPYWKIVQAVATYATGSPDWFPYDVSTNLIRNADHTRIHLDVGYIGDEEWTFLVYLNPNWTRDNYGETAFFETNNDDTEIVAEVRPRYGRAVIFQGEIPHSARPPSLKYTGARLTFVTKLQKDEYTGRLKNIQQQLRQLKSHSKSIEHIEMLTTNHDAEKYLLKMKAMREKMRQYKSIHQNAPDRAEDVPDQSQRVSRQEQEADRAGEGSERNKEDILKGQDQQRYAQGEAPDNRPDAKEGGDLDDDEEDEVKDPEVRYIVEALRKITSSKKNDASKIAELYQEMKQKDANVLLLMSKKIPSVL